MSQDPRPPGFVARLLDRLRSPRNGLAAPRATSVIVALSMLLVAPSLGGGLAVDDYFHKVQLTRDPRWGEMLKAWYELFSFFDGDPARSYRLVDRGVTVWWTDLHLAAAFFRPVSAATHALDYAIWPSHPWLMHAQSIAWYGAVVWVAALLYRRLLSLDPARPAWVAGLAGLLYGFDHNHALPAGWIANRNALVCAFFALAALAAHDVAAREKARSAVWTIASAALFALALGSGESALGALGFLAAHAVFLDARAWRARCISLLPHGLAVVAWAALYRGGGFGVRGSGMYVEPLREPAEFVATLARHLPLVVASELGGPAPDLYPFLPSAGRMALLAVALLVLAWSARALTLLWRTDAVARFFLAGGVLAALPACAVFPAGRLLSISGFGLLGVVALAGAGVVDGASWAPKRSKLVRSFAIWACGGHLLLSPIAMQIGLVQIGLVQGFLGGLGAQLPASAGAEQKRLVLMNAPDTLFAAYVPLARQLDGDRVPARMLTLAGGARTIELTRIDDATVVVRDERGFYRLGTEVATRSGSMAKGTTLRLTDVTIEILRVGADGVPTEAAFRFEPGADSDGFLWMRWEGTRLVEVRPPAVGEHLTIPGQIPWLF